MNFQKTYADWAEPITPSPELEAKTLSRLRRHPRRALPRRLAAAALAALLCGTLAVSAAAQTDMGYALLYLAVPEVAQFFQPVDRSCTDSGVTLEVAAVRVEGDTAQAYLTLTGGAVDASTDLFDSWSFRLPFDQTGHCERLDWDEAAGAVTFLCTTQTLDGSPIPTGGKMTFSVRQLLTGKESVKNAAIDLNLADYAAEAATATGYSSSGGSLGEDVPMLLPTGVLAQPSAGIAITAAGYVDGRFHVQAKLGDIHRTDNHCRLWLEDGSGALVEQGEGVYFRSGTEGPADVYEDFVFDISPEALAGCTLRGDFVTASSLIEGNWKVTFPLKNT